MAQGRQVADAVRTIVVTEVTYYRWQNEYGGLKGDRVKRLKELETENNRLRRTVSDLTLDKLILAAWYVRSADHDEYGGGYSPDWRPYAMAFMCIGIGQGIAILLERA